MIGDCSLAKGIHQQFRHNVTSQNVSFIGKWAICGPLGCDLLLLQNVSFHLLNSPKYSYIDGFKSRDHNMIKLNIDSRITIPTFSIW